MPIRLPKGFARRKSSGNALDEVDNPPAPSFRVIERPDARRSVDGATALKQFNPRPSSPEDPHPDNLFAGIKKPTPNNRGSGGTNNSTSTGGLFDSSSSGRFSSSSTLPSSTDVPVHSDPSTSHTRTYTDLPVPPIPETQPAFSLKAAGRTFSFGTRAVKPPITPKEPSPPPHFTSRDRAMTTSTQSTATPPKLDSGPDIAESDGFGSMFENFGKRKSALLSSKTPSPNISHHDRGTPPIDPPQVPPQTFQRNKPLPSPVALDAPRDVTPSRYSWGSQNSQDGLMESNSREEENMFANHPSKFSSVPRAAMSSGGLRRSVAYTGRRGSMPVEDEDAKAVMDSAPINRNSIRGPPVPEHKAQASVDSSAPLFDSPSVSSRNSQDWGNQSTPRAPRQAPIRTVDEDTSFAAHARLAAQYEDSEPMSGQPTNKVMTPAQFEHYRQQKELSRSQSDASRSEASDDDADKYDEEDELEQKREATRQRQKQEAHLSVYRQQMMKVTGQNQSLDSASSAQGGLGSEKASASSPNLLNRMSTLGIGPDKQIGGGKSSDAEEDDDVPLGILAAHGFPHRNRPPGNLSSPSSNPNLRGSLSPYPPPPASHAGGDNRPNPNRSSALPVFAKNLPQDPYGLVNAPNRESLAMGGGSVHGGPPGGPPGGAPGSLHPGGLVGVIANEERAKAMRRGSPNARAQDMSGGMPMHPNSSMNMGQGQMGPMGPMPGMPGMGGMPNPQQSLTPGDQAQLQMSQQMTQMMQMQMQWMQQMMQSQGMQTPPPDPMNPMNPMNQMGNGFLAPPGPNMRPTSMASNGPAQRQADPRTLSMLDPAMSSSQFNGNNRASFLPPVQGAGSMNGAPGPQMRQGYAPSMAPSERSNVGMSPRYRPVSTVNPGATPQNRASTFTSSTLRPWAKKERQSSVTSPNPVPPPHQPQNSVSNATMTIRPVSSTSHGASASMGGLNHPAAKPSPEDEDEDDGWADMMKKREKKKSTWKMKKENSGLGDLYPAVI